MAETLFNDLAAARPARHLVRVSDDPAGPPRANYAKCHYRLVVDNLMNLIHETFVHGYSIGKEAIAETP
jgi:phenylpropionate dioxygenase-like ring-hydroxylating dioxygenase large terminal subunit